MKKSLAYLMGLTSFCLIGLPYLVFKGKITDVQFLIMNVVLSIFNVMLLDIAFKIDKQERIENAPTT